MSSVRLVLPCVLAFLAGCSADNRPRTPDENTPQPGVSISGVAVAGVAGGSGRSTRTTSRVKDLKVVVGVELDGRL